MATDKTTPNSRRAALNERIDLCRANLADTALAHERAPTAETKAQAERGQVDLAAARQALEMFELALEASSREVTREELQDKADQLADLRKRIDTLHATTLASATKIVSTIEQLGPQYAVLIADLAEARELTASAARIAGGARGTRRASSLFLDGHGALGAAVGAAIASAGFGLVGPSLAPTVTVIPPSGAFRVDDITTALNRLHQLRMDAIEPATTTEGEI